jgi:hypothetical protein
MAVRLPALRAGRLLHPGRFLVLISVRGFVDPRATVRLEGLHQLKNPTTSSGIERRPSELLIYSLLVISCLICNLLFKTFKSFEV